MLQNTSFIFHVPYYQSNCYPILLKLFFLLCVEERFCFFVYGNGEDHLDCYEKVRFKIFCYHETDKILS